MKRTLLLVGAVAWAHGASALNIQVDYTYDTNNFFDTQAKRDAMQAVADRFSRVISSPLLAVDASYAGGTTDWRIGFTRPDTGANWQISTAADAGADFIDDLLNMGVPIGPANVYNPAFALPANTWILYAGGRLLGSAGDGGTGTGVNITSVFDDLNGPMRRGVIGNTPANTVNDLPAWGGSISFNTAETWHFDPAAAAPNGTTDFYSIALHEVGHALGLSAGWNQWQATGSVYNGANAIAAYNSDNGTALTSLTLESGTNPHWKDATYQSNIFADGSPNLVGTVGLGAKQDLLMEPIANFGNPLPVRFELTNVDVGALRDLGWQVIPEPSVAVLMSISVGVFGVRRSRRRN